MATQQQSHTSFLLPASIHEDKGGYSSSSQDCVTESVKTRVPVILFSIPMMHLFLTPLGLIFIPFPLHYHLHNLPLMVAPPPSSSSVPLVFNVVIYL
ncbi:hypothetical protein VNO77_34193 [Canavalia gladiata]|uniref:Transmembrane protein n=1 Tax=Canavalia gladiata TaxID=3824 RepID=A0AAN9KDW5_CANGL